MTRRAEQRLDSPQLDCYDAPPLGAMHYTQQALHAYSGGGGGAGCIGSGSIIRAGRKLAPARTHHAVRRESWQ